MRGIDKIEEQLINELAELRQRISELEAADAERKRVEEALRESQAKYSALVENSTDGIVIIQDGVLKFVNAISSQLVGYTPGELVGINFLNMVAPENREMVGKRYADRMAGKEVPSIYEIELVKKDGATLPVELNATLINYEGRPADLIFIRDITERKRAEEALRRSEQEKAIILNTVREHVVYRDTKLKILWANRAAGDSVGLAPEQLVGRHCYEIWYQRSKPCVNCPLEKAIKTGQPQQAETTTPDGRIWFVRGYPIRGTNGDVTNVFGTTLDITERKRVEEELRASEERLRAIFDGAQDAIFTKDRQGRYTHVNAACASLFGLTVDQVVGKTDFDLFPPEVARHINDEIDAKVLERGEVVHAEDTKPTAGVVRTFDVVKVPVRGANGVIAGLCGIARDITERKKAEQQLERSFVDLAETVSRAMSSRDPYTASHQQRVAELARLVGEGMGLDGERLKGLYIGGLLHDIGKISTPEVILTKPGKLSDEEWGLIRVHAKQGYEILKDTKLPWLVAEMALHHHERLNGSGYPHGISGDELILEVRILGVCDVVEAMGSHRPYRPARRKEEVLEELSNGRGTKYDAEVVDVVLEIIESGQFELGAELLA